MANAEPNRPIWVRDLPCGETTVIEARTCVHFVCLGQVMASNGVGTSEPIELQLVAPGEPAPALDPGT